MRNKRLRPTTAILLSAACTGWVTAHAQLAEPPLEDELIEPVQRYAVEVILFRYGTTVSAGSEIFVPDEPLEADAAPVFGDARGLAAEDRTPAMNETDDVPSFGDLDPPLEADAEPEPDETLQTLEELITGRDVELAVFAADERTMIEEHERLQRLDAYQPVLWSGWTQVVREEAATPSIDLRRLGGLPLAYAGAFKLYLGRFLHLVVDLSLTEVVPMNDGFEPIERDSDLRAAPRGNSLTARTSVAYRISEDRIVNNGDLRYFDHPKYGLIAKVTRLEGEFGDTTDEAFLLPGGAAGDALRPPGEAPESP